MSTYFDETTAVDDQLVDLDDGGLVASGRLASGADGAASDAEPIEPHHWTPGEVAVVTGRFVAVFWAMTVTWFVVFALVPMLVGWTPTVVTTDSMAPTIGAGTVVHVDGGVDLQRLGPGSIITFDDPNVDGRLVTHRVVGVVSDRDGGPTTGFRTKGDANRAEDSTVVPIEAVHGATRLVLPYAGLPRVWMQNGQWWLVGLLAIATALATAVALDTVGGFMTGRSLFRRRSVSTAIAIAIAVMLGGPASNAAFAASAQTSGSSFEMTSNWYLESIDAAGPVAHWRLDDTAVGSPVTVLTEGFETPVVFTQLGSGQVAASSDQARSGTMSAHKTINNDPNGAWAPLPITVTGSFTFDAWVFRPGTAAGGAVDRLGLEDASSNGYSFYSSHTNSLRIDRRTGGNATNISGSVAFNPPEDEWYRLRLQKAGANLTASAFDAGGNVLATTSAVDNSYDSFTRWAIRGGHDYYVDDLTVIQDPAPAAAVDRIGTEDGVVSGVPVSGQPSLLASLPGASSSFEFDGTNAVLIGDNPLINTGTHPERTVELWFSPTAVSGRQVLYEEGGTVNGLNIYLDDGQLYGRAWGQSTGWSNALEVSTGAAAMSTGDRYHVAVVLDAVAGRSLELYLNGVVVGTDTKSDSGTWNPHSDDGALARVNGGTQYHDGNSSGPDGFSGQIDEVVLFNSALTADDIADHWFAGR